MGLGSYYVTSPRICFSTEEYNEWMNEHNNKNNDDDEEIIPDWFYLPFCDECERYREFINKICSHHRSHRILVTCKYCQNKCKTFNNRQVRSSSCFRPIERKLKTYTFEKLKN